MIDGSGSVPLTNESGWSQNLTDPTDPEHLSGLMFITAITLYDVVEGKFNIKRFFYLELHSWSLPFFLENLVALSL
jgi:hypothetical protein